MFKLKNNAFFKGLIVSSLLVFTSNPVYAWSTKQSADAYCEDDSAIVSATFHNTEPDMAKYAMKVTPTDMQTGQQGPAVDIDPGESHTWSLNSGESKLSSGKVEFYLEWSDGRKGVDKRTATYGATDSCYEEPEDVCTNIEGIQEETPAGYENNEGVCTLPYEPEEPSCENCGGGETPDEPKDEPRTKTKNYSIDLNKKVRFEGEDSWKDKIYGADSEDVIEFRIKITNTGNSEIDDLKMTDYLPDELERVGGSGLTEYFGDLEVAEEKTFVIKAKVKPQYLNEERCVVNEAKVEHDEANKSKDSATVCFGEVEIEELPETGPTATVILAIAGMVFVFSGFRMRSYLGR